mgnify:CR=1 FL=1
MPCPPLSVEWRVLQFDLYLDALEAMPYGKYLHVGGDEITAIMVTPEFSMSKEEQKKTQKKIDEKVVEVVKAQHKKALDILNEDKDKLHELANFLYEKETITGEEFMRILES